MSRIVILLTVLLGLAGAQQTRWVYRYDGPGSDRDAALALAAGPDGHLYTAGYSSNRSGGAGWDFTVIGLTRDGGERWVYRYDGTSGLQDIARAVAVGPDSNLYVAGLTHNIETTTDFTVISLTPGGTERWKYKYHGPDGIADDANAVTVGPDGNIYAAGFSSSITGGSRFTVISLDRAGIERWVYGYSGPGDGFDIANSVAIGPDGHIYAVGFSTGSGTREDITVISLTRDGAERWVYRYDGPTSLRDMAYAVAFGPDSNLYVAGFIRGQRSAEFGVISLTPAGTERWVYSHNGPGDESDIATSVAVGPDGNVYAGGIRANSSSNYDFTVISLDPDGDERWMYTHGGTARSSDEARALTIAPDGSIYAAGYVTNDRTRQDFTLINLSSTGTERWVYYYDGPGSNMDDATAVTVGTDGYVYAAGLSTGIGANMDLTVISLDPAGAVAEPAPRPEPNRFGLAAAAFRGGQLEYTLYAPGPGPVRLALLDLQGRKLDAWELAAQPGLSRYARPVPALAAGVYFLTADRPDAAPGASRKLVRMPE